MRHAWILVCMGAAALAQSPEEAQIVRNGGQATLTANSPRPVDAAAMMLAQRYGMIVSVEDPPYIFRDDVKDVTAEVSRSTNPGKRVLIPKGGNFEITYLVREDGFPADPRGLIEMLVRKANDTFPFAYRLETVRDRYTIIPTKMRDATGNVIEITPLMDRRVTIPRSTRSIHEHAQSMAQALSAQTGLHVSCCQAVVAGYPWGMGKIEFEAKDEPAREVLSRLIEASLNGQPNRYQWLQRCDPLPSQWCFINLSYAQKSDRTPFR